MKMKHLGLVAFASVVHPSIVLAQAAPAVPADDQEMAEPGDSGLIIVTANRTRSVADETPVALSAISGEDLQEQGITNPTQLEKAAPNLSIVRDNGLQITIRGVTSDDDSEKGDPSAGFLVNDIYIARPQAQEVSFFDVERVEVLRGPQGTLYGRNTTAGLINVLSRRPVMDEFSGTASLTYESYDHIVASGAINIPVADILAIRVAGNLDRRDSYIINGTDDGYEYDPFKNNLSGRVSLRFEPAPDVRIDVIGDYSDIGGRTINAVPLANFFSGIVPGTRPTYLDPDAKAARTNTFRQGQEPIRDITDRGVTGQFEWSPGDFTLTYLGSYREFPNSLQTTLVGGRVPATLSGEQSQQSHELRLAYSDGDRFAAQFGGYFFSEESFVRLTLLNPQVLGLPAFATNYEFVQGPAKAKNKSVFGQASYEIINDLTATLGARYSYDDKSRVGETAFDTNPAVMIPGNRIVLQVNDASASFDKVTWRVGLDYASPIGLLYGYVATGYKAGGFNDGCEIGTQPGCRFTADALYYEPETLTAYELGFKLANADRSLRLNGALFHYDYSNLQLSQTSNICGAPCQLTRNAALAKIDGIELEGVFVPLAGLRLEAGVNLLDARYDDFQPAPGVDFSGRSLSRSPDLSGYVGASYTIDVGTNGGVEASVRTQFSSEYDLTDLERLIEFYQPGYTKTDITLTYRNDANGLTVSAFARNLENEITLTSADSGIAIPFGSATFADPRTFGVRVGVDF